MKNVLITLCLVFGASVASAHEQCFDPRVTFFQCAEGTVFAGWIKGDCENGMVEDANCQPEVKECFDPRVTFFQCAEGTDFVKWIKGDCENGMVEGAVCK